MPIELPDDLREFAEERVKSGRYRSVVEVVRDAFDVLRDREERIAALREALDVGIAPLAAGDSIAGPANALADRLREGRRFEDL